MERANSVLHHPLYSSWETLNLLGRCCVAILQRALNSKWFRSLVHPNQNPTTQMVTQEPKTTKSLNPSFHLWHVFPERGIVQTWIGEGCGGTRRRGLWTIYFQKRFKRRFWEEQKGPVLQFAYHCSSGDLHLQHWHEIIPPLIWPEDN